MREFAAGAATLLAGFGYWRRTPRQMLLGLIPAVVVALLFATALVVLAMSLPGLVTALTPFADGWADVWAAVVRIALGVATFGGALLLAAVTFTATTLVVGEPFYDRIWRAVEQDAVGVVPDVEYGFWRAVGDGVTLVVRGVGVAIVVWVVGLVPVAGTVIGFVAGVLLTGRLLTDELTSRALTARGIGAAQRRALLRRARGRALGFGAATQVCFLIPLGAVAVMPAAVAGSTLLAQRLVSASAESEPRPRG